MKRYCLYLNLKCAVVAGLPAVLSTHAERDECDNYVRVLLRRWQQSNNHRLS